MPKLYFRYGTMNSSKTMNLLMVAHNYEQQGIKVILIKPLIDSRFEEKYITSRTGFKKKADIVLGKDDRILMSYGEDIGCVLVDEVQFLSEDQIDELRVLSLKTPVICYGLRTDYRSFLFPGAKRLMELADSIEEIKTICMYCSKKSIINMKHSNGIVIKYGDGSPDIGCEEKYLPVCWSCWYKFPEKGDIKNQIYDDFPLEKQMEMPLFSSREDSNDTSKTLSVIKEELDREIDYYQRTDDKEYTT